MNGKKILNLQRKSRPRGVIASGVDADNTMERSVNKRINKPYAHTVEHNIIRIVTTELFSRTSRRRQPVKAMDTAGALAIQRLR